MFFRLETDHTMVPVNLEGTFAGPLPTPCWLIGGGPSLARLDLSGINKSPIPKMTLNLAGVGLIKPNFWTAYDPSSRFLRSTFLDAGIMKFVQRRRGMDLIPDSNFKVCEAPNLYFFDRDGDRGFADFLTRNESRGITDWADTMIQGIEILHRLGFRKIFLAGCEMVVRPSPRQLERARSKNISYQRGMLLGEFIDSCKRAGISEEELSNPEGEVLYHFDERKGLAAAIQTDAHYFRVAQYLRLSRKSMSSAGLELISVTPRSRLNGIFPFRTARSVVEEYQKLFGDDASQSIRGRYQRNEPSPPRKTPPMRDLRPHNWREKRSEIKRPDPAAPRAEPWPEIIEEKLGWEHVLDHRKS